MIIMNKLHTYNYLFNQMKKIFRQKYQYNPDKPVFSSENVKTYNCMNT
jgi:hypothetical protein